jgi:hypothetical protein
MQGIKSKKRKVCEYESTCENKFTGCLEEKMTEMHAKPIIENKFWIIEKDGEKVATLRKNEDRFVLSNAAGSQIFKTKESLTREFGKDFFVAKIIKEPVNDKNNTVQGYPTSVCPFNAMYDIKRKLPLYTKNKDSKSLYCAGYYIIKFDTGWKKAYCPKVITLQRYPFQGPYKTEFEMKQALSNAK